MLGTIVNSLAIFVGSIVGILIKGGLKERYKIIVLQAVGLSVLFVGISGALGGLQQPGAEPILFIISLVLGGIIGEFLKIEEKLNALGLFLESKFSKGDSSIAKGFVTASLLFCVGTMAILGALESGVQGIHTTLFAKSVLDGITSIIFASTMGIGVLLSAASVFIYQGSLTLLARVIEPYLTADMIREITIVGGMLITGLSLDMLGILKVKVGNLLPAITIPVFYYLIKHFLTIL